MAEEVDADRRVLEFAVALWESSAGEVPTDIVSVMRQVGLRARFVSQVPPRIRGLMTYPTPGSQAGLIYLSLRNREEEIRWTIAHEIIHHAIRAGILPECPDREERICQMGAAHLLMPPPQLLEDAAALDADADPVQTLRAQYLVSTSAMRYQLERLGIRRPRALWPARETHVARILQATGPLPEVWRSVWRDKIAPLDFYHEWHLGNYRR
jgi:hypothetical protein